jgi:hypothetical protein
MSEIDLTWRQLQAAADRLTKLSTDTVSVWAYRRRRVRVIEGLGAGDKWVAVQPERVRWRWPASARWHEIQSVDAAAAHLEIFLKERPDQPTT